MTKPLIIFELANNHCGSLDHAIRVITRFSKFIPEFPEFEFAFKTQYRDLDTFLRPDHMEIQNKHIQRFLETRLTCDEKLEISQHIVSSGFVSVCTPFDEVSVDEIMSHGYRYIKVASCSLTDWPLLEKIGLTKIPVIASTAGADVTTVDNIVKFFANRDIDLTLMHCVAIYPTLPEQSNLQRIRTLSDRYPNIKVGYSTHESPDDVTNGVIAVAKGSLVFEKHVGIETTENKLNGYSANPEQICCWLNSIKDAYARIKTDSCERSVEVEKHSLHSLKRGAFSKVQVKKGQQLDMNSIQFSFPCNKDHLSADHFSKYTYFTAEQDISLGEEITFQNTRQSNVKRTLNDFADKVVSILDQSGVILPKQIELEISHHYGVEQLSSFGCGILTMVNRQYCKKYIVFTSGQCHPQQFHQKKEETFFIVSGELEITLDGAVAVLLPGQTCNISPGVQHQMKANTDVVLEEISTSHHSSDSFYTDPLIQDNKDRKTVVRFFR